MPLSSSVRVAPSLTPYRAIVPIARIHPTPSPCRSGYFLSPRRGVNLPFHPGHHRAVQHFIKQHFGSSPLTVFHWRSEHVDESMLVPCSQDLAGIIGKFEWPGTPSGYRGILMSDMPAPNNNHIMVRAHPHSWHCGREV